MTTEKRKGKNSTIFDDVFRTMAEKMPKLLIPLINEVFHKDYSEEEQVELLKNEHMTENGKLITDASLRVRDCRYHVECQSRPDGTIAVRMFEYDVAAALRQVRKKNGQYHVIFPKSCVLYLRHSKKTKEKETVWIEFADGSTHQYEVPIIKVQEYTKEELFQKKLLLFLPYYLMRYEKELKKICADEERFKALLEEYKDIQRRLEDTLKKEESLLYTDLNKLIVKISDYLLQKEEKARKGIGEIVGGQVLELYSEQLLREGREEGIKEGIKALVTTCASLGATKEVTAEKLKESFALTEEEAKRMVEQYWKTGA